jgi:hypothetical protein
VLTKKPVEVFVGAALPGMVWSGEIDRRREALPGLGGVENSVPLSKVSSNVWAASCFLLTSQVKPDRLAPGFDALARLKGV